jgi:hypothetical protein
MKKDSTNHTCTNYDSNSTNFPLLLDQFASENPPHNDQTSFICRANFHPTFPENRDEKPSASINSSQQLKLQLFSAQSLSPHPLINQNPIEESLSPRNYSPALESQLSSTLTEHVLMSWNSLNIRSLLAMFCE